MAVPSRVKRSGSEPSALGAIWPRRSVPVSEPSDRQTSRPDVAVRAENRTRVPDPARAMDAGSEPSQPGSMSLTRTVADASPLLFQSSRPEAGLVAEKNRVPLAKTRSRGPEPTDPG